MGLERRLDTSGRGVDSTAGPRHGEYTGAAGRSRVTTMVSRSGRKVPRPSTWAMEQVVNSLLDAPALREIYPHH